MSARIAILALFAIFASSSAAWSQEATEGLDFSFRDGPRQLAPGVLKIIPPDQQVSETFAGPRMLTEIAKGIPNLEWTPNYLPETQTLLEKAKGVTYRRAIWGLEFAFKPVRMMYVDIPQPNGVMKRKLVWYMVYRIVNRGGHLNPVPQEDQYGFETYQVQRVADLGMPIRVFPHFTLRVHDDDPEAEVEYLDRALPVAIRAIQNREDPFTHLYSSVQISQFDIPLSTPENEKPIWGVAVWEDVDPRTDYFSVYVRGLTNAHKFADDENFQVGSPPTTGRLFTYKTLQLNFWRPGDAQRETEQEVRYGVPVFPEDAENQRMLDLYNLEQRVDHRWIYR